MNANELAAALGAKRQGREWVAICPAHDDREPSLWFRDGDRALVVKCRAGCEQTDVIDALRSRGLWENRSYERRRRPRVFKRPVEHKPDPDALAVWRSTKPADDLIKGYLQNRYITLPVPPSLRVSGMMMVAGIQALDRRVIAVQTTRLTSKATKAEVARPRITTGHLGCGAVRFAAAGDVLGLAEGPESALSAMQITGIPCWATLGADRLPKVEVPAHVRTLIIFGDNDRSGRAGAERAAEVHRNKRSVELRFPPDDYNDWNDVLQGGAA